jgi:glycolate oxidase
MQEELMEGKYNKVSPEIAAQIKTIVGEKNVLFDDPAAMEPYAYDSAGKFWGHMPEVVVKAENAEQISAVMRLANEKLIPVTPRGAGSGLAAAAVPVFGGILLSMEKMNKILEIDEINMCAVCEPGVVTNDLCGAVEKKGLFYAGYPMSVEESYIGSNTVCNAGGAKVVKYGSTRDHVLGVEIVTPTGQIMMLGGKIRKETSGYSLLHLLIGSEGTLGVVTKVILNLIPSPGMTNDLLVPFSSMEDAVKAASGVVRKTGVHPVVMEFMDIWSVNETVEHLSLPKLPAQEEAEAYLLITFEGKSEDELDDLAEKAGTTCLEMGALDVFVASTKSESERVWSVRIQMPRVVIEKYPHLCAGDVVVPVSKVAEFISKAREIIAKYDGVLPVFFGHIGDGNVHPSLADGANLGDKEWVELSEKIQGEISILGVEMGGAVSGEHGVGVVKKACLKETSPSHKIALMKGIKEVFDPNYILNPGKLFE